MMLHKIVHQDAIHHTNLLNGVKVNVGKSDEGDWEVINTKNEDRYHIQTICREIATNFFINKDEEGYVLVDFQRRPILSIELDTDFQSHALREFEAQKVVEELPPLIRPINEQVGTLTDRLIVAYESSGMENGHCKLSLVKMKEIRNEVFGGAQKVEEHKSSSSKRRSSSNHRVLTNSSGYKPRRFERRHPIDPPANDCSPGAIVVSAALATVLVTVASLFNMLFSDDNKKEQRVTRMDSYKQNAETHFHGGKIY